MEVLEDLEKITTDRQLRQLIENNKMIFVDVYAEWCQPCRLITPWIMELSKRYPHVKFVKMDVDRVDKTVLQHLGQIKVLPTFLLLEKGRVIKKVKGADKPAIIEMLR